MIRKTQPSAWTARRIITGAVVLVCAVFVAGMVLSPPRSATVAVIGDRADTVRAALGTEQAQDATVTIVLLDRWGSLSHLPDVAELCWDACYTRAAAQISLTQMRFGRTRKVVVFHLPDFDGDLDCVATRAAYELQRLRAAMPACSHEAERLPVWILPMGLGRIS